MKKIITLSSFVLFSIFYLSFANAQCTEHAVDGGNTALFWNSSSGQRIGQTFTACETGEIVSITIGLRADGTFTNRGLYELYVSDLPLGTPPLTLIPGSPVATKTLVNYNADRTITYTLTDPFPVVADGTTYRFEHRNSNTIQSTATQRGGGGADYADGTAYQTFGTGSVENDIDLDFEVNIVPPPPPVPTMGEWGLLILALLLMTCGTLYLIERKIVITNK